MPLKGHFFSSQFQASVSFIPKPSIFRTIEDNHKICVQECFSSTSCFLCGSLASIFHLTIKYLALYHSNPFLNVSVVVLTRICLVRRVGRVL